MARATNGYIELEVVDVIHMSSIVYIKTKRVTKNIDFIRKMNTLI